MRRRDLLAFLSGVGVWLPLTGQAQQPERVRRVGVLMPFPEEDPLTRALVTAFTQALARLGWVKGGNVQIDYRFAVGDPTLFKTYAAELVSLSPDAILADTILPVAALREQTRTIPIVFVLMPDPVGLGVVQNLARPGGNITGFSAYDASIFEKWLQLLKEIAPNVTRVAVIFNPDTVAGPYITLFSRAIAVAPSLGVTVTLAPMRDDAAIENVVAAQATQPGAGLITLPDPFMVAHHAVIIAAAARHSVPLMGLADIFPRAGGLMSYGFDPVDVHAQAASYIDRILKGANPADLPVQQLVKLSLIINLKTAKTLGLTVPQSLIARADEVIE
jgi:putative ABC transport system substrate-binding protein